MTYPYGIYSYSAPSTYVDEPVVVYRDDVGSYEAAASPTTEAASPTSSLGRGLQEMRSGQYDRAVDRLLQAVLADPEAGRPKLLFAHALFAVGDYGYAVYALRRALDRIDDLAAVEYGVDDLYHNAEEFDRLLYQLRGHAKKNPSDVDVHLLLGYLQHLSGQFNPAIRSLNRALELKMGDRHATALRKLAREDLRASSQPRPARPKVITPP